MTIVGTNSALAFAPQASLGNPRAANHASFGWIPFITGTLGVISNQDNLPTEVSGSLLPGGAYKTGFVVGGRVECYPRVSLDAFHWLLACHTSGNYRCFTVTTTGFPDYYRTYYGVASTFTEPTNTTSFPTNGKTANDVVRYLTGKMLLPKVNGQDGEIYGDLVVSTITLDATRKGPLRVIADMIGRTVSYSANVSGTEWTYSTNVSGDTIPTTCVGTIQSPQATIDLSYATRITVQSVAQLTPPDATQPHFAYSPRNFAILARTVTVTVELNLEDYSLPRQIFYNGGNTWDPIVWLGDRPFFVEFRTPGGILGDGSVPGAIAFWARRMAWAAAPMETTGGALKTITIVGTLQRDDTTSTGAEWYIRTTQAGNRTTAWPTT